MEKDLEIEAMGEIAKVFGKLEDSAKARVVSWVINKYNLANTINVTVVRSESIKGEVAHGVEQAREFLEQGGHENLLSNISSKKANERILLVSAHLQHHENKEELTAFEINNKLRNLGHPASNITVFLNRLIKQKPSLVMQVSKGKGRMAKKKYRVTGAGFNKVKEILNG